VNAVRLEIEAGARRDAAASAKATSARAAMAFHDGDSLEALTKAGQFLAEALRASAIAAEAASSADSKARAAKDEELKKSSTALRLAQEYLKVVSAVAADADADPILAARAREAQVVARNDLESANQAEKAARKELEVARVEGRLKEQNAASSEVERRFKEDAATPTQAQAPQAVPVQTWTREDCLCGVDPGDEEVACIDLVDRQKVVRAPSGNILAPNRGLAVFVRTAHDEKPLYIELGGVRGLTVPALSLDQTNNLRLFGGPQPQPKCTAVRFSPRQSGRADLVVKRDNQEGQELARLELEVDQRFWGAVRFGLAAVAGSFRSYEARAFAGSQTLQLWENRFPAQFEFVVGFAPYPEALGGGGRSYTRGNFWNHLGPYLGFGLVGQSAGSLDALTSLHAGIEFEFARDLSVALTFVLRKGRALASGYVVGSPVEAGAAPESFTTPVASFGGGLVISSSPSFLQFATGTKGGGK
jgi:hypothetical protein